MNSDLPKESSQENRIGTNLNGVPSTSFPPPLPDFSAFSSDRYTQPLMASTHNNSSLFISSAAPVVQVPPAHSPKREENQKAKGEESLNRSKSPSNSPESSPSERRISKKSVRSPPHSDKKSVEAAEFEYPNQAKGRYHPVRSSVLFPMQDKRQEQSQNLRVCSPQRAEKSPAFSRRLSQLRVQRLHQGRQGADSVQA